MMAVPLPMQAETVPGLGAEQEKEPGQEQDQGVVAGRTGLGAFSAPRRMMDSISSCSGTRGGGTDESFCVALGREEADLHSAQEEAGPPVSAGWKGESDVQHIK